MAAPGDLLALIGELFRPSPTPPPVPASQSPDPAFAEREKAYREELARRDANAAGLMFGLGPNLLQAANSADPREVFLNQFDPSLSYTDVYARGGEPSIADKVMGFGAELAEPGPGEFGILDDVLPLAASVPGFFRLLQRNPEITGTFDEAGAFIQRRGAEMELLTKPDGSVEVSYLRRGEQPGTGSELKQVVRNAAQQEAVDLTAINAPFGPGNVIENMRINADRLRREGYVQLPDGTWILRAQGR